jgi:hypothetical protein
LTEDGGNRAIKYADAIIDGVRNPPPYHDPSLTPFTSIPPGVSKRQYAYFVDPPEMDTDDVDAAFAFYKNQTDIWGIFTRAAAVQDSRSV